MKIAAILLFAFTATFSYAIDALDKGQHVIEGKWVNIHMGNPNLAGIVVRQFPLEPHKGISFKGKHPFIISFVMWNGEINETYYTPEGKIISAGWWNLKKDKSIDPQIVWQLVDFRYGSDPSFKKHKDPRKKNWKLEPCTGPSCIIAPSA